MATFNYDRVAKRAVKALVKYGTVSIFRRVSPSEYNPETGEDEYLIDPDTGLPYPPFVDYNAKSFEIDYIAMGIRNFGLMGMRSVTGSLITVADRLMIVAPENLERPRVGDLIVADSGTWAIKDFSEIPPNNESGKPILFFVHLSK